MFQQLTLKFLVSFLLSFTTAASSFAFTETAILDPSTLADLAVARDSRKYAVRILEKNDRSNVVVLLGEVHIKNSDIAALGMNVVRHFPTVAIENASWMPEKFSKTYRDFIRVIGTTMGCAENDANFRNSLIILSTQKKEAELIELEQGFKPNIFDRAKLNLLGKAMRAITWVFQKTFELSTPESRLKIKADMRESFRNKGDKPKKKDPSFIMSSLNTLLIDKRNIHMIKTLSEQWIPAKTQNRILVIAGGDHIPGLVQELEARGYNDLKFDDQDFVPEVQIEDFCDQN